MPVLPLPPVPGNRGIVSNDVGLHCRHKPKLTIARRLNGFRIAIRVRLAWPFRRKM
jgi:hypothetical protein